MTTSKRISIGGKRYKIVYEYHIHSEGRDLGVFNSEAVANKLAAQLHGFTKKPVTVTRIGGLAGMEGKK